MGPDPDTEAVREQMGQDRATFRRLLDSATDADLRRPSNGTKWTNQQLLFHMLFGYLIVRTLLLLTKLFGRLPDRFSRAFARLLDAMRRPFHVINYLGSRVGGRVFGPARMGRTLDRVIANLQGHLTRESPTALRRAMHYPTSWDPFFKDYMTLADLYCYPTQHFDHHRRQLSLDDPRATAPGQKK